MRIAFLRHGRTVWNLEGRIQGHRDVPLSAQGERDLAGRTLPRRLRAFAAYASPLARARKTAALLGLDPLLDERLLELDWGAWEGAIRTELRARDGAAVARIESAGIDFRPPGGESTRELMARLESWIEAVGGREHVAPGAVAVTHKGVIRAALAMATGWDFRGRAPEKLDWDRVHEFELAGTGELRAVALNQALETGSGAPSSVTP